MSLTQTEPRGSNDSTVHETAWTSDALADAIALKAVAPIQSPRAAATVAPTALSAQPPTPVRHDSQAPILRRSDTSSIPETGAERESGLQPVDGGPGAYRFLIASGMFELVCWGQSYAYGAYESYHEHNPASPLYGRASPAAVTAVGTLLIAGMHFVPLMTRGFFRTYPHWIRRCLLGSVLLTGASLILASFLASHVEALLVFQGLVAGLLQGLTFTPVITWLPQWWDKRIGFASGVLLSGSGIGGTVFPFIINKLLQSIGFEWTLRVVAAYTVAVGFGAALLLKPRLPVTKPSTRPRSWWKILAPEGLHSLLHPFALLQLIVIVVQAGVWCTISLYLATWTSSLGFSASTATGVLSGFNAASTVGYIMWGRLIDSVPYLYLMATSALMCSLSCFLLLGFSHSLPLIILFSLLFGAAGGGFTTFITPITRRLALMYNHEVAPIYLGIVFIRGFPAVLGPLIGSSLYDRGVTEWSIYGTRGFRGIVIYVGAGMLLASILSLIARQRQLKLIQSEAQVQQRSSLERSTTGQSGLRRNSQTSRRGVEA